MASLVDEQQQWFDPSTNTPIVNGSIFVGERNADPQIAKAIFSDRELTTALANPQSTDSSGRSLNKIWTEGRYSIEVQNSDDVQKYIELDNGEGAGAGVIALGDVQGANTITATASTTITAYEDLQQYVFRTAQINTGAVTLNIDSVGAKSVVKNNVEPIQTGNFKAIQNIIVTYNLTNDNFEWSDQNLISGASYKGTDVVSASTIVIPTDGDYFELTGTTTIALMTVDSDRQFKLKAISGMTITNSASIVTPSGADIELTAGEILSVQSTAANVVQVLSSIVVQNLAQKPIVSTLTDDFTTSGNIPFDDTIPQITEGGEVLTATITPTDAANILEISIFGWGSTASDANDVTGAIFRDATASALYAANLGRYQGNSPQSWSMRTYITAGSVSSTTFRFRAGAVSGALYINSNIAGGRYGGVAQTTMTIKEYLP